MSLITCGSIHEWFSDDSRGRQEIFMCVAVLLHVYYVSNFADSQTIMEVPRYRSSPTS